MPPPTTLTPNSSSGGGGTDDFMDLDQLLRSCTDDIAQHDRAFGITNAPVSASTADTALEETLNNCLLDGLIHGQQPPIIDLTGVPDSSALQLSASPHQLVPFNNDCQANSRRKPEPPSQDTTTSTTWFSESPVGRQTLSLAYSSATATLSESHPSSPGEAVCPASSVHIVSPGAASSGSPPLAMYDSPHSPDSHCEASTRDVLSSPITRLLSSPPSSAGQEVCHSTCDSPAGGMEPDQAITIRTPVRQLDSAAEVSVNSSDAESSGVAESDDEDGPPVRRRRRYLRRVAKASRRLRRRLTTPCPTYPDLPDSIERGATWHRRRSPHVDLPSAPRTQVSSTILPGGNQSFGLDARIMCQGAERVGLLISLPDLLISSLYAAAQKRERAKQIRAGLIRLEVGVDGIDASPSSQKSPPPLRQQRRRQKAPRPYSDEEDERLLELKEQTYPLLSWKEIAKRFPGRTRGALQVRYCTALKGR